MLFQIGEAMERSEARYGSHVARELCLWYESMHEGIDCVDQTFFAALKDTLSAVISV